MGAKRGFSAFWWLS